VAESPSADAVQEEVDTMVDEAKKVADRLGVRVGEVARPLPGRLSDEEDDARRDADEKREGDAEAHQRRLPESRLGRWISVSGLVCGGHLARALSANEDVDDCAVEEEDENKRDDHNDDERQPRSHVVEEELVLRLSAADAHELAVGSELGTSRPELVEVLRQRQAYDHRRSYCSACPPTAADVAMN